MDKDSKNPNLIAVGLMSGTSMDGIDAALLLTNGDSAIKRLGNYSLPYDKEFKFLLKACEQAVYNSKGDLDKARAIYEAKSITFDQVIEQSTDLHIRALKELLAKSDYHATAVDIIGYHGQTLFHHPSAHLTVQAGDAQKLANETGIAVAYDFRSNDIKNGGQGAPLAPIYHQALANQDGLESLAVVNCGGITNITITGKGTENLYAYDCGPGNTLIDRFVHKKTGENMDKDGLYGSKGTVNEGHLQDLKRHAIALPTGENYLNKKPPKSLDVNDIVLLPSIESLSLEDGCATLEAFTAECIVQSLSALPCPIPTTWVLAGGGWQNKTILHQLKQRLDRQMDNVKLLYADEIGWSSQFMEAELFAFLAVRCLQKLPISFPNTTGVCKPMSGGKIAEPRQIHHQGV